MVTCALCWVLFAKGIIGLALPIISSIGVILELVLAGVKVGKALND